MRLRVWLIQIIRTKKNQLRRKFSPANLNGCTGRIVRSFLFFFFFCHWVNINHYYYYYYYYLLFERFYQMVFHWSLSDSKSPQVSRTRLSILAVLSDAVIWIVSTRLPTSKYSRPFNNPSVIVPKVQLVPSSLSCSTAFSIL